MRPRCKARRARIPGVFERGAGRDADLAEYRAIFGIGSLATAPGRPIVATRGPHIGRASRVSTEPAAGAFIGTASAGSRILGCSHLHAPVHAFDEVDVLMFRAQHATKWCMLDAAFTSGGTKVGSTVERDSLRAQGDQRIDSRRPPCRDVAGQQRDSQEHERERGEHDRIVRTYFV